MQDLTAYDMVLPPDCQFGAERTGAVAGAAGVQNVTPRGVSTFGGVVEGSAPPPLPSQNGVV